jgi:hypothetical protein
MSIKQYVKGVHWSARGVYRKKVHFTRRIDCLIREGEQYVIKDTIHCESPYQTDFFKRLWKKCGPGIHKTKTHTIDEQWSRCGLCRVKLYEYSTDHIAMRFWSHCPSHTRWLLGLWNLSGTEDLSGQFSNRYGNFRFSNHMYLPVPNPSTPVVWNQWEPRVTPAHFNGQEIDDDDIPF